MSAIRPSLNNMTENQKNEFLKKIALQAELNRYAHGEGNRIPEEWVMIVQVHIGHLFEAIMKKDKEKIEKEILHVAAPLMELYQEVIQKTASVDTKQLILPDSGDPWNHARKLPGGIEEIRIENRMSGEIKHLFFKYNGKTYSLCDWTGSQPELVKEEA